MQIRRAFFAAAASVLVGAAAFAQFGIRPHQAPAPDTRRDVDLAICLDTSGSMDGLIDAAKQKLWAIVNDLALAEPMPRLRVALLTYGNNGHLEENGWVQVGSGFTEDLDLISEKLFALTTNGGTELVGRVIHASLQDLEWSQRPGALQLIVVAGNESADQDQVVRYPDACKAAIERGIMVNAIYCGDPADSIAPGWQNVAQLADGHFATINQNGGTVVITTPFDEELGLLSAALNETYLPMGDAGLTGQARQWAQDKNAEGLNTAAVAQRANSKVAGLYNCPWDLVDACKAGTVVLAKIEKKDLPEAMRDMTLEEQQAFLDEHAKKRSEVQVKIAALSKQRQAFVEEEMKKLALSEDQSFDKAVRAAIRSQAGAKGFRFEE